VTPSMRMTRTPRPWAVRATVLLWSVCLATPVHGFRASPRVVLHALARAAPSRASVFASSRPGGDEPLREEDKELLNEFEEVMRKKMGIEDVRAREQDTLDNVVESGRQKLEGIKGNMDAEFEKMLAEQADRLRAAAEKASADVSRKMDEAEAELRQQQQQGTLAGTAGASGGAGGATPASGAGSKMSGAARARSKTVAVVGAGGPLMRALSQALTSSGNVGVRAVVTGEAAGKGRKPETLAPWPDGDDAIFSLQEVRQAQRYAVQRTLGDAAAVVICLVDGEGREWCLDETTARRWVEGAGGGSSTGGSSPPELPIPVEAVDVAGRLIAIVSAQGTQRAGQMPYAMQNVWGQLDTWRKVEQEVVFGSKQRGYDHSVVFLGKIVGKPASPKGSGAPAVVVAPGDVLGEGVSVTVAADALARVASGEIPAARNSTFSVSSAGDGSDPVPTAVWTDQFLKCVGPELVRLPLASADVLPETVMWVRDFALSFGKKGSTLPTPVYVVPMDDGAKIVFLKSGFEYSKGFDDKDGSGDAAPDAAAVARQLRGKADGALRIVVERTPAPRVRVYRCDMEPGVVVKEMSENTILARLKKELPKRA